jgi:hypothetical protein
MTALGWQLVTSIDAQNPQLGDLRISGSRLARLESFGDSVTQACNVALRWWLGEWFLDRSRGVPYLQSLLRKGVGEGTVRAVLRKELLRVEGVAQVARIDLALDKRTRRMRVSSVEVVTTDGVRRTLEVGQEVGF